MDLREMSNCIAYPPFVDDLIERIPLSCERVGNFTLHRRLAPVWDQVAIARARRPALKAECDAILV